MFRHNNLIHGMNIPLLGKGNFLLSKLLCNRQNNLTRLGIIVNQLDK
jgi:hypothetical protein